MNNKKIRTIGKLFLSAAVVPTIFFIPISGCSNNKNEEIVEYKFEKKQDSKGKERDCLFSKDMSFNANYIYTLTFSFEK